MHHKSLYLFFTKCILLYILWNTLFVGYLFKHTKVEEMLTSSLASVSSTLMHLWGYNTNAEDVYDVNNRFEYSLISLEDELLVLIANSCNGLSLIILFVGFIVAYPGYWKMKVIYCVTGSILIYLINLVRIQILFFNIMFDYNSFDFNHKYTYTIAVYLCIFILWMLWVNRLSSKNTLNMYKALSGDKR